MKVGVGGAIWLIVAPMTEGVCKSNGKQSVVPSPSRSWHSNASFMASTLKLYMASTGAISKSLSSSPSALLSRLSE